jgi:hypothetical protein
MEFTEDNLCLELEGCKYVLVIIVVVVLYIACMKDWWELMYDESLTSLHYNLTNYYQSCYRHVSHIKAELFTLSLFHHSNYNHLMMLPNRSDRSIACEYFTTSKD